MFIAVVFVYLLVVGWFVVFSVRLPSTVACGARCLVFRYTCMMMYDNLLFSSARQLLIHSQQISRLRVHRSQQTLTEESKNGNHVFSICVFLKDSWPFISIKTKRQRNRSVRRFQAISFVKFHCNWRHPPRSRAYVFP
jgi:hypothetical protein